MAFRLRYQDHDLELPPGEFVIGRGMECQLAVDDPLVSRRHAALRVDASGVVIEDLGSRNGVRVNGVRIEGPARLSSGDRIEIGTQQLVIEGAITSAPPRGARYRRRAETLQLDVVPPSAPKAARLAPLPPIVDEPTIVGRHYSAPPGESSRSIQSLTVLGSVAEKALALGHVDEAERLLGAMLAGVLAKAKAKPADLDADIAEQAARYGLRLALSSGRSAWLDYVFELFTALGKPPPAPLVDELYTAVRRVKGLDLRTFRAYLSALRAQAASFGPSERFLLQRLEGLERLLAFR